MNWPGRKIFTVRFGPASQSIGRGRLSWEGALDVRESRERRDKIVPKFSPGKQDKNVILACFFSLFWAGSLVVRESRHLRDRISDKNSKKRKKWVCFFFKSGRGACASRFQSCGFFHFFGRGKTNFWGGGTTSKLARQWPSLGIYKHAPALFWRKRRLLYWKKGGQINSFSWGGKLVCIKYRLWLPEWEHRLYFHNQIARDQTERTQPRDLYSLPRFGQGFW